MNELNSQDNILIDNFLLDQLTEGERARYNERMSDPLFAKELAFRREQMKMIEQKGNEKLYKILEEESTRIDSKKPKKKMGIYWIILALFVIAGLCYFVTTLDSRYSNEELFMAYYEVFPNLIAPTERSNGENLMGVELALYAYDRGDFQKAVAVFDTLSERDNDLMIYQAIAEFESGQIERAKKILITISNDNSARYREASEWYLCLIYLKGGDIEKYSEQFKLISSSRKHRYYSKALNLNHEME